MDKKKIFIALGVGIVLLTMLAACGGNTKAKTVSQFITNYNNEIKETLAKRIGKNEKSYRRFLNMCTISGNAADVGGMKMRELYEGDAVFMTMENNSIFQVQFAFKADIPADALFPMIEAATLATGDDYKEVFKKMGILTGKGYNIRHASEYEIDFGVNHYSFIWADDAFSFVIVIPK